MKFDLGKDYMLIKYSGEKDLSEIVGKEINPDDTFCYLAGVRSFGPDDGVDLNKEGDDPAVSC
jgi:hypothetical protein